MEAKGGVFFLGGWGVFNLAPNSSNVCQIFLNLGVLDKAFVWRKGKAAVYWLAQLARCFEDAADQKADEYTGSLSTGQHRTAQDKEEI